MQAIDIFIFLLKKNIKSDKVETALEQFTERRIGSHRTENEFTDTQISVSLHSLPCCLLLVMKKCW